MKAMLFVGGPMDGETRCIELERVIVDVRLYPKPSIFDPLEQYYREVKYERTIVMLPDGKRRTVMVPITSARVGIAQTGGMNERLRSTITVL